MLDANFRRKNNITWPKYRDGHEVNGWLTTPELTFLFNRHETQKCGECSFYFFSTSVDIKFTVCGNKIQV